VLGKFRPFDFCRHFFRASRPNTISLMFNRKKLFSSVKKDLVREFPLQTKNPAVKIVIFVVNVLHGSVVVELK